MRTMKAMTIAGLTATLLTSAQLAVAQQETKPPMHMHKAEMDHSKPDKEVAAEFKSEAQMLADKAASHRKLAKLYRSRTGVKGQANYESVAKHCDQLADAYEQAAKRAQEVAAELAK